MPIKYKRKKLTKIFHNNMEKMPVHDKPQEKVILDFTLFGEGANTKLSVSVPIQLMDKLALHLSSTYTKK